MYKPNTHFFLSRYKFEEIENLCLGDTLSRLIHLKGLKLNFRLELF